MNSQIIITGYEANDLSLAAADKLRNAKNIILHTVHCEAAKWLDDNKISYTSLDNLYETSDNFDAHIMHALSYLEELDEFTFCAMDSSDELAKAIARKYPKTEIYGGGSSAALELLSTSTLLILSASDIEKTALSPLNSIIIKEIDTRLIAGDVKLKLLNAFSEEAQVYMRLTDGKIINMQLMNIDRLKTYNHVCACLINPETEPKMSNFECLKLINVGNALNVAGFDDESIAKSLACVVKYIRLGEEACALTQEEIFELAAQYLSKGE